MDICDIKVMYDYALFDHFPVAFALKLSTVTINDYFDVPDESLQERLVDWSLLKNKRNIEIYIEKVQSVISNIAVYEDINYRDDIFSVIDDFYNNLVEAFTSGRESFRYNAIPKFKKVPGWNLMCKRKYKVAHEAFFNWVEFY